jgi:hypothetical protein
MATITGVWEWRIVGGGEDRRHINSKQGTAFINYFTKKSDNYPMGLINATKTLPGDFLRGVI